MDEQMLEEIEAMGKMSDFLFKNAEKLPLLLQIRLLENTLEFSKKLKPIYIAALLDLEAKADV